MTISLTNEQIYVGIILTLMAIQIYQQRLLKKLEKDSTNLWNQVGNLFMVMTAAMTELDKRVAAKEEKK